MFCSCRQLRGRVLAALPMTPRPVQPGPGVELLPRPSRPQPRSVLRVRADCERRLFTAKLGIITHDCTHKVFDHLLPDDAILLVRQFRDRLRDCVDDFICFIGIDFSGAAVAGYSAKKSSGRAKTGSATATGSRGCCSRKGSASMSRCAGTDERGLRRCAPAMAASCRRT